MFEQFVVFVTNILVYTVFVCSFILSIIFTFSLSLFLKLDFLFNFNLFSRANIVGIESNVDKFDVWVIDHNKLVGPVLIIFSFVDLICCVKIFSEVFNI